ncbi:MAG: pseudouridine synthase [Planctomycetota bacterium]|nr:pseudouridine synthase [Planctomycetota bacterium]
MSPSRSQQTSRSPRSNSQQAKSTGERLQKILALAGFGSRRDCETLITEGRVEVDGKTVSELGTKVDSSRQKIAVDGERIKIAKKEYFLINKPTGVLSTNWDPSGRTRVIDLIPTGQRVFTVGRLDKSSEGLIIVTNDGAVAQRLTHPRYGVEKVYEVVVSGHPSREVLRQLMTGVRLSEGWAKAKRVRSRRKLKHTTVLEIVLNEGKNREIRRLMAKLEHKVIRLKRIAIGRIRLGDMQPGECRALTRDEIKEIRRVSAPKAAATSSHRDPKAAAKSSDSPGRRTTRSSKTSSSTGQRSKTAASTRSGRATPTRKGGRSSSPTQKLAATKRGSAKRKSAAAKGAGLPKKKSVGGSRSKPAKTRAPSSNRRRSPRS